MRITARAMSGLERRLPRRSWTLMAAPRLLVKFLRVTHQLVVLVLAQEFIHKEQLTLPRPGGENVFQAYSNGESDIKLSLNSNGSASFTGNLTVAATGDANFDIVADSDNNGTNQWPVLNFRRNSTTGTPAARIYQKEDNNALVLDNNGSERMRIDSSGRLLIGASSSTSNAFLQVNGGVGNQEAFFELNRTNDPTNGQNIGIIEFSQGNSASRNAARIITRRDGGVWGAASLPTRFEFHTCASGSSSPTERMRIGSGGETSCFAATSVIASHSATGAGTAEFLFVGRHSATGIGTGTDSVRIYTNGNIVNTNNSYTALSDVKLKENIVDANSQWDDIKALRVRNYNLKEGQTHTQIGLVAQEVEPYLPWSGL